MQLNEIMEENTLESISQKTRIASENLEKLFSRDFGAFRKVQALGFISILEREYHADLSAVHAECIAYFSGNAASAPEDKPSHASSPTSRRTSPTLQESFARKRPRYLKPIVITLIVLGLLYGAWQTLASNTGNDSNQTQRQDAGFFASIIQRAKTWMGNENNMTQSVTLPKETQGAWAKDSNKTATTLVISKTPHSPNATNGEDKKVAEEENRIIQRVKEQQAQAMQTEKNQSDTLRMQTIDNAIAVSDTDTPLAPEVPSVTPKTSQEDISTQKSHAKVAQERALAQKQAKAAAKKLSDEAVAKQKAEEEAARRQAEQKRAAAQKEEASKQAAAQKAARLKAGKLKAEKMKAAKLKAAKLQEKKLKDARAKAAKLKAATKATALKGKIVLQPRANIWIGKVNLATMQRSTVTTSKPLVLDGLKGRWILATGHGRFSLKIGNRMFNFNDSKKHFLIIQKGTAHEIPHATFQKLNKSKVW